MLDIYRALELGDEKGLLCGKLLADLGMDVIKVEPPGGDKVRNFGPFYHDIPDSEKSLFWYAYNNNKRGITLNLQSVTGRMLFKKLVKKMDVVIESFPPGYMKSLGLGYGNLRRLNPDLIMVSITPFGQDGPYKEYKTTDIVNMALGGFMFLTGDEDRPPLRVSFPQSCFFAGSEAASAVSLALFHRTRTGEGQYIDVSLQQALAWTGMTSRPAWDLYRINNKRAGPYRQFATGTRQQQTWECKDGYVALVYFTGKAGIQSQTGLVAWMKSEGMTDEYVEKVDWEAFDMVTTPQEFFDRVDRVVAAFFKTHTKKELYEGALKRRIMLNPVSDARDLLESSQLKERNFWVELEHPELGQKIHYPGPFVKASETPVQIKKRAPLIGEHNEEIYMGELSFSRKELVLLRESGTI